MFAAKGTGAMNLSRESLCQVGCISQPVAPHLGGSELKASHACQSRYSCNLKQGMAHLGTVVFTWTLGFTVFPLPVVLFLFL